jgi:dolichyl-diphosphooligosaccharide--protein glycosyltransferase
LKRVAEPEPSPSPRAARIAILLALVCASALALRVVPQYDDVVQDGRVVFAGNDPWIHMRNAANVAAHWPMPSWFDPYRLAPEGQITEAPLMDIAIAGIALATPFSIDAAGAWFPAVLGALVPIPLFFLTRRLFGVPEAIVAAALIAVLPGTFLAQSLLGVTDHHVAEVFLAICTLLFLVRALETGDGGDRDAILAGIFLGFYLLTWARGAFLVLILIAWAMLETWRGCRIARIVAICFGVALLLAAPVAIHLPSMELTIPLLVGGTIAILVAQRIPSRLVPLFALAIGAAIVIAVPGLLRQAARFLPGAGAATVAEVQPLLRAEGRFSVWPLWWELTTSAFLAPIGVALILRHLPSPRRLLLVWSLAVTAAALAQGRFAYYMAAAAAIFSAVAAVRLFHRGLGKVFAAAIIAAIVIYPNVPAAIRVASGTLPRPTSGWLAALDWMRAETPEPFGSPAAYVARYTKSTAPRAAYSVMAWWDYGWWVSAIARRPPATNPTQVAVREAAQFYTATTEADALEVLASRRSRFVIVDRSLPMTVAGAGRVMSSQLETIARWGETDPSRFYELAWDRGRPLFLYHPDYYRTMAIRLFGYDGRRWTPSNSTWAVMVDLKRNLVASRRFATYEDAVDFVDRERGGWRLVGLDPVRSCVPLEPLTRFSLAFASPAHDVKVFRVD